MTVHVIAHLTIHDHDAYRPYADAFMPILDAHGGRLLTVDDEAEVIDGAREPGRTVVLEFDSEEAFRAWWDSPEYREIAAIREANSATHSIVLTRRSF